MFKRRPGHFAFLALAAGFLAVVSLVLPWFDLLGKERSSIDLLRSASALDVIEGWTRVLVLACWLAAPILVSIAMLTAASGRHRLAAALLLPVGVVVVGAFVIGAVVDDVGVAWGAVFGAVFASISAVFAVLVFASSPTRNVGRSDESVM